MMDDLLSPIPGTNSTYHSWMHLITNAKKSLRMAFFYSNLRNSAPDIAGGYQGNNIFNEIVKAKKDRGVDIKIVQVCQIQCIFLMSFRINPMINSLILIPKN
jgi:hypothetical protein